MKRKQGLWKQAVDLECKWPHCPVAPNPCPVSSSIFSGKGLVFHVPKETLGRKAQITVMFVLFSLN